MQDQAFIVSKKKKKKDTSTLSTVLSRCANNGMIPAKQIGLGQSAWDLDWTGYSFPTQSPLRFVVSPWCQLSPVIDH